MRILFLCLGVVSLACSSTSPTDTADADSEVAASTTTTGGAGTTSTTGDEDAGTSGSDEDAPAIDQCASDADCNDELFCNGVETCAPDALEADDTGCIEGEAPKGTDANPVDCMVLGECDEETESFPTVALATGDACDDGIACTIDDVCGGDGGCKGAPDDNRCDDGLFCTGTETCNTVLGCLSGNAPVGTDADTTDCLVPGPCDEATQDFTLIPAETGKVCDDAVDCTLDDGCTGAGTCEGSPNHELCSDDLFCNGAEICDPLTGCGAGQQAVPPEDETPDDCMTFGPCDEDSDGFGDVPHAADTPCDDGIACTLDDVCDVTAGCAGLPTDAECDNGVFCDGPELCAADTGCEAGTPPLSPMDANPDDCLVPGPLCDGPTDSFPMVAAGNGAPCSDGVGCTADACDGSGACQSLADDTSCSDDDACNGAEVCNATDGCQPGLPLQCDDDLFCNGLETCAPETGCVDGTTPEPPTDATPDDCSAATACNEDTDSFDEAPKAEAADCQDGDACTDSDACDVDGTCVPGAETDCDDQDPCTTDTCDSADGCAQTPVTCETPPASMCDAGGDHVVYDATGTCDSQDGACDYLATTTPCDDQDPCTVDTCDATAGCSSVPMVCDSAPAAACDGSSNHLTYAVSGTCNAGVCEYAETATSCDDADLCTTDLCDPAGGCNSTPGVSCDSAPSASCNAQGDHVTYAAAGTCNPVDGQCSYGQTVTTCTDADLCSPASCDPAAGCSVSPVVCDTPPASSCDAAGDHVTHDATGTCNVADGQCDYAETITGCDDAALCTVDACTGPGGCTNTAIVCVTPPAAHCDAGGDHVAYVPVGTCNAGDGQCQYLETIAPCDDSDGCT
ncbi:MAG: hypothetical protein ACI9WU_003941, partial [Myxococcota bacterium]